ncbi:uncharacterized protein LOC110384276 isoform X2 [Helicoverpa armigera]|uniref:uncharacterized protein LOC110384276 isoform X2 n=1 Tax=Helicoverpa armigera TaxID=29058 RepID=UPI003082A6C1
MCSAVPYNPVHLNILPPPKFYYKSGDSLAINVTFKNVPNSRNPGFTVMQGNLEKVFVKRGETSFQFNEKLTSQSVSLDLDLSEGNPVYTLYKGEIQPHDIAVCGVSSFELNFDIDLSNSYTGQVFNVESNITDKCVAAKYGSTKCNGGTIRIKSTLDISENGGEYQEKTYPDWAKCNENATKDEKCEENRYSDKTRHVVSKLTDGSEYIEITYSDKSRHFENTDKDCNKYQEDTYSDGTKRIVNTFVDGSEYSETTFSDGTKRIKNTTKNGKYEENTHSDGTRHVVNTLKDGSEYKESTYSDGTKNIENTTKDGKFEENTYSDGTKRIVHTFKDGSKYTEKTYSDKSRYIENTDKEGNKYQEDTYSDGTKHIINTCVDGSEHRETTYSDGTRRIEYTTTDGNTHRETIRPDGNRRNWRRSSNLIYGRSSYSKTDPNDDAVLVSIESSGNRVSAYSSADMLLVLTAVLSVLHKLLH